jgi:hypothetical protein
MSSDPKNPAVGDVHIDATDLLGVLVDKPPEALIGLLTSQPGLDEAVAETVSVQPIVGVQAGVRDEDVAGIQQTIAHMSRIKSLLPAASKLVEVLQETHAVLDDRLQRQLFTIAATVENRAKMLRNDELLARYGKTRAYRSAIGKKAARTRKRNLAAQEPAPIETLPVEKPEGSALN